MRDGMSVVERRPWIPTERQTLLVRAALLDREPAIDAWNQWNATGGLERIDDGSSALLPIVYRNLAGYGVSDSVVKCAQQAYKTTWLENERRFHEIAAVLEALNAAGIETMILKGVALALLYYRDLGLRSMGDVDLLVHPEQLHEALAALRGAGFRIVGRPPELLTDVYLFSRKAINLASAGMPMLDLHWRAIQEVRSDNEEKAFWDGAAAVTLRDVPTRAMSATDQVLHICEHETRWCPSPLPRWMVDLVMVFRVAGDAFDSDRTLDRARSLELLSPLAEALECLDAIVPHEVPQELLQGVRLARATRRDQRDYEARCRRPGPLRTLRDEYRVHCDRTGGQSRVRRCFSFVQHVQALWGLERPWQLVPRLWMWGWHAVCRIASGHVDRARCGQR